MYTCYVCGVEFMPERKNAKCCSKECSKRKEALSEFDRRKRKRSSDHEYLLNERRLAREYRDRNKESEAQRRRNWRLENIDKDRNTRARYRKANPEKEREKKKRQRERRPDIKVKEYLKSTLGFSPPTDLVEEATALRLLNRAIKKAGE